MPLPPTAGRPGLDAGAGWTWRFLRKRGLAPRRARHLASSVACPCAANSRGRRLRRFEPDPGPWRTAREIHGQPDAVFRYLHVDDNRVQVRQSPGVSQLSADEESTLDRVIADHGQKPTWQLVNEAHRLPQRCLCAPFTF